jgi:hypothetical protein
VLNFIEFGYKKFQFFRQRYLMIRKKEVLGDDLFDKIVSDKR